MSWFTVVCGPLAARSARRAEDAAARPRARVAGTGRALRAGQRREPLGGRGRAAVNRAERTAGTRRPRSSAPAQHQEPRQPGTTVMGDALLRAGEPGVAGRVFRNVLARDVGPVPTRGHATVSAGFCSPRDGSARPSSSTGRSSPAVPTGRRRRSCSRCLGRAVMHGWRTRSRARSRPRKAGRRSGSSARWAWPTRVGLASMTTAGHSGTPRSEPSDGGSTPPASTSLIGYLHRAFCWVPIAVPIGKRWSLWHHPLIFVLKSRRKWGSCAARSRRMGAIWAFFQTGSHLTAGGHQ
jgi:hypothetical protein